MSAIRQQFWSKIKESGKQIKVVSDNAALASLIEKEVVASDERDYLSARYDMSDYDAVMRPDY